MFKKKMYETEGFLLDESCVESIIKNSSLGGLIYAQALKKKNIRVRMEYFME